MTEKNWNEMDQLSLEEQADAFLAAAEAAEIEKKSAKKQAAEKKESPSARLDEKLIASLPAAAVIQNSEKLQDLLAKCKKQGKVESSELMDVVDEMDLDSEQMDRLYDSLEVLNIEI